VILLLLALAAASVRPLLAHLYLLVLLRSRLAATAVIFLQPAPALLQSPPLAVVTAAAPLKAPLVAVVDVSRTSASAPLAGLPTVIATAPLHGHHLRKRACEL
jgi:hypothetical protein